MLPSIIERLVIQGDAQIVQQTIGLNGANTIEVPKGKTVVILNVNLQPLLSLADVTANWCEATFSDWTEYVKKALVQSFDPDGTPTPTDLDILELILKRGLTQIELYSTDNRTVLTYTNEYQPVPILSAGGAPLKVAYLPNITERNSNTYSVHKNQIHVRLHFANSNLYNGAIIGPVRPYPDLINTGNLENTVPETTNDPFSLLKNNLYMSDAQVISLGTDKFGIYPFANETLLTGSDNLAQYVNGKFFLLPYSNDVNTIPNGKNGELGFFALGGYAGTSEIPGYAQLFSPYINIQYALINEQPQGLAVVTPDKYQTVIPK
jgi:hypothetical protein